MLIYLYLSTNKMKTIRAKKEILSKEMDGKWMKEWIDE